MKTVSVIIPNYNYGRFLREAIDSALGQTHPPHEVIVIDDGSTDESREILESYGMRIRVHYQQNEGVGAARNKGAEMATGEVLAFLDADDLWAPAKIEKQLADLESKPNVGLVHCGLQYIDENGRQGDEYLVGREGEVAEDLLRFEPVISGPGGTSLIPRSVFLGVGGYDTNKDLHPSEDWELSYRIATKYRFAFVPEPLLFYRQHGSGGHTNIPRMERAMLIAYGKAFADCSEDIRRIRRECYGNFYMVLAGSYFHSGNVIKSITSVIRGLVYHPANISRLLGFPFRAARRVLRPDSNNIGGSHSF
jgi:glycosyltransferase involved in cell wall biosynthesis